ncbi:MAG: carbon monoxide dehydrogenase subunit G [Haloarculaceae archaeon]
MEYEGTATIPARREAVWDPITDPGVLTACVMGAEEIERVSDTHYEGVIRQELAGATVSLAGEVTVEERDPPERLRFTGAGTDDRTNSHMEADAAVRLTDEGATTTLSYDVEVTFAGKLATLGARVLRRQVRANVRTYFDNLAEHVGETA